MKSYSVTAFFPEVKPAHRAEQHCVVQANNMALAAKRGLQQLRKEAAAGKRVTTVRLTIRVIGNVDNRKEQN
jgi:hypothetical protein